MTDDLTNQPVLHDVLEDGIAILTLARPKQRNSLTEDLLDALLGAIETHGRDPDCRVIIIASLGPAFCAGHDIKQLTAAMDAPDRGEKYFSRIFAKSSRLMMSIVACPRPVIAQVQGICSAAGCQIVASADLAIAARNATFTTPGVDIGLFCSTPMVAVSRNMPRKKMMEMLLTADVIDADLAVEYGLINHAVEPEALAAETLALARKIASKPRQTIALGKQAFYRQVEAPLEEAYNVSQRVMVENMLTHDAKEGLNAFMEKRKPRWRDK